MNNARKTTHPINKLFTDRWSPRAFDGKAIDQKILMQLFEAARWAPSCFNYQPWRFLYAMRDTSQFTTYLGLLNDYNSEWADRASTLVFVLSDSRLMRPDSDKPIESINHIFDSGMAYGQFALQATRLGLATHAMQGFNAEKAHKTLKVPAYLRFNAAVAVGRQGTPDHLSDFQKGREKPSDRRPLSELVAKGHLPEAWLTPAAP